ncbi:MAG TPA: cupin domain-containing protein [candidate division Zixibacteria bacterium]|nr:cupin domain-containing protein [candidate division Zixibacteria bacterium]
MWSTLDRAAIFALALLATGSCSRAPRLHLQYGSELKQTELARFLEENPLGAGENIKVTTLGRGREVSHHIVQVREREEPHVHERHDGTVVVLRGGGYLMLDGRRIDIATGDAVYIPRGAPHYFVNTGSDPAIAFVIFSPPFDGKDYVAVRDR